MKRTLTLNQATPVSYHLQQISSEPALSFRFHLSVTGITSLWRLISFGA